MINDLLKSISSKDFVSAKEIVESLISEKISTLIDLKKIEVAESLFNHDILENVSPGEAMVKFQKVVDSSTTKEHLKHAEKYGELVFQHVNKHIKKTKGFGGLGDSLELRRNIKSAIVAKSRTIKESAYAPEERLADLTKIKTATLQQIHALHRHYGQKDPRSKESANRAAVELKKRGIIVPMDEAWKHEDEAGKRAHGEFQEKDHGKWFTYRKTDDPWAAKHGLTHKIDVADGHRFGKVMGTRVHIATDENDDGSPKMETWHLKKHNKWAQNESVEIKESELTEAKIDHKTALDILNQAGGSTSDFHELGSNEVDTLLKHAKIHKYRKSPSAPGSTARMFHQHLTKIVRANEKSGPSWK